MENLWKDIRYGARMLTKNPGFTAVAVLSLALGIGVNSTIFSLVNAILLRPLPVSEPERLVAVFSGSEQFEYSVTSYPDYIDFRDENDVFSGLAAHSTMSTRLTLEGSSEIVLGEVVTGNYFHVLGVEPAMGRWFLPEEDETPDTHPVAVVSHGFWERRFGSDPSILGKEVRVNGLVYTIVGVTPDTFTGTLPGFSPEIWVPMMMTEKVAPMGMHDVEDSPTGDTRLEQRGNRWLFVKGRLKEGVTLQQAETQLATVMKRLEQEYPVSNEDRKIAMLPAAQVRFHPVIDQVLAPAAWVILAVVGMVLLIACANVANMLLARATSRKQEIAVRLAIGASRGRLLRQLVTESLLLSGLGGALGLFLAHWTAGLLMVFRPSSDLPITLELGVDTTVFLFTLGISILAGLVFGLVPALQASRPNLVTALKGEAASTEKGERRLSIRNVLVVAQVAVSLVLLIAASLLVRSLQTAQSMEVGFDADRLAVMGINLDLHDYSEDQGKVFNRQLLERIRALPEVTSATQATRLPITVELSMTGVYIEGHQQSPDDQPYLVDHTHVGPGYFRTFGIQLTEGRDFDDRDTDDSPQVAIINETMARTYWPTENAIGKRFHTDGLDGPTIEIVGVCRDYNVRTIGEEPRPYVHSAISQEYHASTNLVVRTDGDPAAMVGHLRQDMLDMDPDLVFTEADTMPSLIDVTLIPVRMGAVLIGLFGILGMMLAAVGLYGVIAYSVSRRTHEIGLRMALGAEAGDVLKMVFRQGMLIVLIGIALGSIGAAAVSRILSSVLYGISAVDPLSFGVASTVLLGVAFLANWLPARRAARIDPMIALRYE
jgi:predicted permease